MKVDIKESIYELISSDKESITVRCTIDGNEEVWVPTETDEDAVYELVVDGKTYHYDHAKAAPVVAAALKVISQARTATNAQLVDSAAKNLRSILASLEPLVKIAAPFKVSAASSEKACQIVYVACEGDPLAERAVEILHKEGKVVETLMGMYPAPQELTSCSKAFQAAWADAKAALEPEAPMEPFLHHNDIVRFKEGSRYFHPGYFRVDCENAIGATCERPWIGALEGGAGWYIDRPDQLQVVLSSEEFDTEFFKTNEDIEEALSDKEHLGGKTAAAGDPYGVRWKEFNKQNRIVTKEQFFPSEKARESFANNLEKRESFKEFDAWTDPSEDSTHEAAPEAAKFEVNCVGAKGEILWSKKAKTKKEALALISEAKKSQAIHIELIDEANNDRTWYYDRKSVDDKWGAPVEM
jgi:hypothetical protein